MFIAFKLYYYSASIDTLISDSELVQNLKLFIRSKKESINNSTPPPPSCVFFSHLHAFLRPGKII